VLVTKKPGSAVPSSFEGYRDVAWLGRQNAIVTLPAVSSLKALRQNAGDRQAAANDYAGYDASWPSEKEASFKFRWPWTPT
jgi:hypothetical protein